MTVKIFAIIAIFLLLLPIASAASINVTTVKCEGGTFKVVNDTIECVKCLAGFTAVNGTCVAEQKSLNSREANNNLLTKYERFIDGYGEKFTPENPSLGRLVLFILSLFIFYFALKLILKIVGGKYRH